MKRRALRSLGQLFFTMLTFPLHLEPLSQFLHIVVGHHCCLKERGLFDLLNFIRYDRGIEGLRGEAELAASI